MLRGTASAENAKRKIVCVSPDRHLKDEEDSTESITSSSSSASRDASPRSVRARTGSPSISDVTRPLTSAASTSTSDTDTWTTTETSTATTTGVPKTLLRMAPWQIDHMHPENGFRVKTEVKASQIPGADKGRYVLENVPKDAVVRTTRVVSTAGAEAGVEAGTTVTVADVGGIQKLIKLHNAHAAPAQRVTQSTRRAKTGMTWVKDFAGTPANSEADEAAVYIWGSSNVLNAALDDEKINVELRFRGDEKKYVDLVTLRDIATGEELYQDYRTFQMPQWFRQELAKHNMVDARTMIESIEQELGRK